MAGLLAQLDLTASGADLSAIAGGIGGAFGDLGKLIAGWQSGPPGDFGSALSGLGGLAVPQLSGGFDFSASFGNLLPSLQGELGGLAQGLQGDIAALPETSAAICRPRSRRCSRASGACRRCSAATGVAGLARAWKPAAALAQVPEEAAAGAGVAGAGAVQVAERLRQRIRQRRILSPPSDAGALDTAQVAAARSLIDTLPADLTVPSLLRWVHARVGTFPPGLFPAPLAAHPRRPARPARHSGALGRCRRRRGRGRTGAARSASWTS